MKKFLSKQIVVIGAVVALLFAGAIGYSQTQFNELYDVIFRPQNPQVRFSGTLALENLGNEEVLSLVGTAAAVNEVTVTSAITAVGPSIAATGGDTNIPLNLAAKGTGNVNIPHPLAGARSEGVVGTAATDTLTAAECGAVIVGNATSGTQVFTLPAVTNTGCVFTFIAGHAGGEILVNAAAVATCVITSFAAVGVDADTGIITDASCETGLKNTAATNAIGDSLTIVSDGVRWLGVGITSGIWASQ